MAISPFKVIISIVILIRLILFGLPSFEVDMNLWIAWAERIVSIGPLSFYSEAYFSDYFPGYLYILWILGGIHNLIIPFSSFNTFSFEVFIKSATTIFDIGTAFYIFKIIQKYQKSLALLGSLLYLANPALVFNSSIWGQIDGVFTFFLVLSAYYLLEKKDTLKSNISFSLAILIKPQSLALLPIIVKKNLDNNTYLNAIKKLAIIPIILIILSFPFFINDPFLGLINLGIKAGNVYPYNSLFAFNFWSLFGFWQNDSRVWLNLSYQTWGFILYGLALSLLLIPLFIKKIKDQFFYFSSALSFLIFYLFLTRIHERYIFPFFAFLLIAALIKKSKVLLGIYVITSLIHLANLWYVYYYYNYVFLGVGGTNFIYSFLTEHYKVFSIILVSTFILLLVIYYRSLFPSFKPKIRFK